VVLVAERSAPWSTDDQALLEQLPAALLVHNKCDLPAASGERPPGLLSSALRGDGIDELLDTIGRQLVPDPPLPGEAAPFTNEQVESIRQLMGETAGTAEGQW
jgi:tRNA modification GTPase